MDTPEQAPKTPAIFLPPTFDDPVVQEAMDSIDARRGQDDAERRVLWERDPGEPRNPFISYPPVATGLSGDAPGYTPPALADIESDAGSSVDHGTSVTFTSGLLSGTPRTTYIMWFVNGALVQGPSTLTDNPDAATLTRIMNTGSAVNIDEDGIGHAAITVVAGNSGGMDEREFTINIDTTDPP